MDRAVRASQAVNLPQNRTIVHTIVKEFMVDGVGDIIDPLGLSGSRLEVQSLIIDAFAPHIKTLIRAVELSGGDISGLGYGPLIAAQAALSKRQRDLGTAIVDLGFGTTGFAYTKKIALSAYAKFPVGAGNISNDLAVGLKVPVDAAEEVKLHYGYAYSKEVPHKESVDMKKFADDAKGSVSRKFIAEIIESRLEEIFDLVNNELKLMEKYGQLPGGVVLVGGGAKLPGLTDLVKQEMKLAAQIGFTLADEWEGRGGGFKEYLEDPEFVGAFGLVLWGMESEGRGGDRTPSGAGLKNFFRYFAPLTIAFSVTILETLKLYEKETSGGASGDTEQQAKKQTSRFQPLSANVKVIGIGGGGGNAVARMAKDFTRGVDFIAINTDHQDLTSATSSRNYILEKV